jgi:hypothetical protein
LCLRSPCSALSVLCVCCIIRVDDEDLKRERHKLVVAAVHNNAACVPMCV